MKFVVIGSGNVAHLFATRLFAKGHEIVQVFGRNPDRVHDLAQQVQAQAIENPAAINLQADAYLLAVSDSAIAAVASQPWAAGKMLIHFAGSLPLDVLGNQASGKAVIWPLYSILKNDHQERDLPLMLESDGTLAKEIALETAGAVSLNITETGFIQRQYLHLNAVLVNNFTNHLLAMAAHFCKEHDVAFATLEPIIRQTIERAAEGDPAAKQSGPAIRHDQETMQRHLLLLNQHPEWQQLYSAISHSIQKTGPLL